MTNNNQFNVDGYEAIYNQLSDKIKDEYNYFVKKHTSNFGRPSDNYEFEKELHLYNECKRELDSVNRKIQYKEWFCNEKTYERQSNLAALKRHFEFTLRFLFNYDCTSDKKNLDIFNDKSGGNLRWP